MMRLGRGRSGILVCCCVVVAYGYSVGCGKSESAATPTTTSPIIPLDIVLPSALAIDVTELRGGASAAVSAKGVQGSTDLAKGLYNLSALQTILNNALAILSTATVTASETTTAADVTFSGGEVGTVDFSDFTMTSFSSTTVSVDPTATCSGNAQTLPLCIRMTMTVGGAKNLVFSGKITKYVTSSRQGAGAFCLVAANTTATTTSTLFDGSGSANLCGLWDQDDTDNLQLELFASTGTADSNGIAVSDLHTHVTQVVSAGTTKLSVASTATYTDAGTSTSATAQAVATVASGVAKATYDVEGTAVSDLCLSTTDGSSASGCVDDAVPIQQATAQASDTTVPEASQIGCQYTDEFSSSTTLSECFSQGAFSIAGTAASLAFTSGASALATYAAASVGEGVVQIAHTAVGSSTLNGSFPYLFKTISGTQYAFSVKISASNSDEVSENVAVFLANTDATPVPGVVAFWNFDADTTLTNDKLGTSVINLDSGSTSSEAPFTRSGTTVPVYLCVVRDGDQMQGFVSTDGATWSAADSGATSTRFSESSAIGVISATHNTSGNFVYAIDYFRVSTFTSSPSPRSDACPDF